MLQGRDPVLLKRANLRCFRAKKESLQNKKQNPVFCGKKALSILEGGYSSLRRGRTPGSSAAQAEEELLVMDRPGWHSEPPAPRNSRPRRARLRRTPGSAEPAWATGRTLGGTNGWAAAIGYGGLRARPTLGRPQLTAQPGTEPRPQQAAGRGQLRALGPRLAREPLPETGRRPRTKSYPPPATASAPLLPDQRKFSVSRRPRGRRAAPGGLTRAAPEPTAASPHDHGDHSNYGDRATALRRQLSHLPLSF